LFKAYQAREIVRDVSLNVKSGEVVGLLGPNGAGKTTSFYMIVGLVQSDSGNIYLDRHEVTHLPMEKRASLGVGYLPQESSIFRKLSVEENIRAVLEVMPDLSEQQRERRLENLLREFHLGHLRERRGDTLSGGERRRTEIARALATRPRFVLLDEPFAGVDPISILDLQRIIQRLAKVGIGTLITDHNVRDTLKICDRAYIVSEGSIIAEGSPEEVLAHEQVREVYLGSGFSL
jgi:lipopolysaccharide export system ATP-binding protein